MLDFGNLVQGFMPDLGSRLGALGTLFGSQASTYPVAPVGSLPGVITGYFQARGDQIDNPGEGPTPQMMATTSGEPSVRPPTPPTGPVDTVGQGVDYYGAGGGDPANIPLYRPMEQQNMQSVIGALNQGLDPSVAYQLYSDIQQGAQQRQTDRETNISTAMQTVGPALIQAYQDNPNMTPEELAGLGSAYAASMGLPPNQQDQVVGGTEDVVGALSGIAGTAGPVDEADLAAATSAVTQGMAAGKDLPTILNELRVATVSMNMSPEATQAIMDAARGAYMQLEQSAMPGVDRRTLIDTMGTDAGALSQQAESWFPGQDVTQYTTLPQGSTDQTALARTLYALKLQQLLFGGAGPAGAAEQQPAAG